jgi:hypothetical protein
MTRPSKAAGNICVLVIQAKRSDPARQANCIVMVPHVLGEHNAKNQLTWR